MENNQSAVMVKRSSTPPQEVRSKPAKLKTINQLKATDRPTEVKAMLQKRSQQLLLKLCARNRRAQSFCQVMPGDAPHQLIKNIGRCEQAIDAWMRNVTATATEIVAKFYDIQQEYVTLRVK